jgi:hypothetical protein
MGRSIYARLYRKFGPIPSLAERQDATQRMIRRSGGHYPLELKELDVARDTLSGRSIVVVGVGFGGLSAFPGRDGKAVSGIRLELRRGRPCRLAWGEVDSGWLLLSNAWSGDHSGAKTLRSR